MHDEYWVPSAAFTIKSSFTVSCVQNSLPFNCQTAVMFTGWLYLGTLLSQQCHIACHGVRDNSEAIARHITVGGIASASITSRMGVCCGLPYIISVSALRKFNTSFS